MKKNIALFMFFIFSLSYGQNVTTVRKPILKVFTGNYDSKETEKTAGRMKLEIRQVKAVIAGTLNYRNNEGNTEDLKISGYVQNNKAHIQIINKSGNVGSAVLTLEADILTFSFNGSNALLPKKISLLRI